MKTRYSPRRAFLFIALVAVAAGTAKASCAETMTVDSRAPLAATLLPTVTVVADVAKPDADARWHVAADAPLPVTLMPTVRVSARIAIPMVAQAHAHAPAIAAELRGSALIAHADVVDDHATPTHGLEIGD